MYLWHATDKRIYLEHKAKELEQLQSANPCVGLPCPKRVVYEPYIHNNEGKGPVEKAEYFYTSAIETTENVIDARTFESPEVCPVLDDEERGTRCRVGQRIRR